MRKITSDSNIQTNLKVLIHYKKMVITTYYNVKNKKCDWLLQKYIIQID